jgi:UDP-N-acetylmuramate dehydrogenase
MVWVHQAASLRTVLDQCRGEGWKVTVLGAGTRVVVREGGVRGVVLRLGNDFTRIQQVDPVVWQVGAAVPVPALVALAAQAGLTGLERFANVPGTLGASLMLDEGWEDVIDHVQHHQRGRGRPASIEDVQGRKRLLLGAQLRLKPDLPHQIARRMRKALDPHKSTPPSSWYHKPKRGSLRRILRSVELPRVRLRRVSIPGLAPELLVNLGQGSASDLALLHRSATERVKKTRGIELESRMRWIGARVAETEDEGGAAPKEER